MPVSELCSCCGVGLVIPCCLRLASARDKAILTLPNPIFPVGDVKLVLVVPEDSFTSVPSRSPVTSDFALSSEPASRAYFWIRRSADSVVLPALSACARSASGNASNALAVNSSAARFVLNMRPSDEVDNHHILRLRCLRTNHNFAQSVKFTTRFLSLRGDGLHACQRFEKGDQVLELPFGEVLLVALGVKAHHVAQRREAAVVHVRRSARHVAQPGDADEEGRAAVGESAVGELRAGMARAAVALADEGPQAAPRREGIARGGGIVAALQRIAEVVERRAARDEGLLEGGEGFADIDKDFFVRGGRSPEYRPIFA